MKTKEIILTGLFCIALISSVCAQTDDDVITTGKKEVNLMGFLFTDTDFKSITGLVNASYGLYVTDRLLIGLGVNSSISIASGSNYSSLGVSLFGNYNFSVIKKGIPYIKVAYNVPDFFIDDFEFGYTQAQLGFGYKIFLNKYMAWDNNLVYAASFGSFPEGGIMFITGLAFIF